MLIDLLDGFPRNVRGLAFFDDLRRQMDRLLTEYEGVGASGAPLNLTEFEDRFVVELAAPGVAREALTIRIENDAVTVSGERKLATPDGVSVHRRERGDLSFARSFGLPAPVDADKSQATLKDGILTLTLPKHPRAQARAITIN